MYLRLTKVRRGGKTYRYAQIVESYRREDGTPTNRVLANLGQLDDVAVANVRAALEANRAGHALQITPANAVSERASVVCSLRYLDLAVLLELWRKLGLDELVRSALPHADTTAENAEVVAALVLQRCVAPASKYEAKRWYPRTALPEIQGIDPRQFNNSRVHRALEALDEAEAGIREGLPKVAQAWSGAFGALFIDATDTWFVGEGPELAQKGRDKEGIYRRRIGVVLLCDQQGIPLRWHTLSGKYHDGTALLEMAREAASLPWTRDVPVVMDRAAGHAGAVEQLDHAGLRYVTALPDPELESTGAPIPWALLENLQVCTTTEEIARRLAEAGFTEQANGRWVSDLGKFEKNRSKRSRPSLAMSAIEVLERIEASRSLEEAATRAKLSRRSIQRHKHLRDLIPEVREELRTRRAERLVFQDLVDIAALGSDEQMAHLEELIRARASGIVRTAIGRSLSTYPARAVLCVSPQRLLDDRGADEERLREIEALVEDLNRRLAHPGNRRTNASALAELENAIRRRGLGSTLQAFIAGQGSARRVRVERDENAWAKRRRGDGLAVIIAHPEVAGSAHDLVSLYYSKDCIERDFRVIKSTVELRPVYHRTDPKVRAHVTLCILALALLRGLENQLGKGVSGMRALQELEAVHLSQLEQGGARFYSITRPSKEAKNLLKQLALTHLVDDRQVASSITARAL